MKHRRMPNLPNGFPTAGLWPEAGGSRWASAINSPHARTAGNRPSVGLPRPGWQPSGAGKVSLTDDGGQVPSTT
jgi:hypothetical protein